MLGVIEENVRAGVIGELHGGGAAVPQTQAKWKDDSATLGKKLQPLRP